MTIQFELENEQLQSAIELLRDTQVRCETDACALCRLDAPEAQTLARRRLEEAELADTLLFLLAQQ